MTPDKNIFISRNSAEKFLCNESQNLYFFFGGFYEGIAMPPLEFFEAAKILNENKIYLRDFNQCWYHTGLYKISKNIEETAEYLQSEINQIKPKRIFFIGSSMGGFAAILFANLLKTGEAIAFAPQSFISNDLRNKHNDDRWSEEVENTFNLTKDKKRIFDLRTFLLNNNGIQKTSIFVSKDNQLDLIHSNHLKDLDNIAVFEFDNGGHGIAKLLRDKGELPNIISGNYGKS